MVEKDGNRILVLSTFSVPIIQAVSYFVLILIYYKQRRSGLHTSVLVWFYLTISLLCNAIDFYSVITTLSLQKECNSTFNSIVNISHFPILVLLYLLECIGDNPVIETDHDDPKPESPELKASFFSKITFWWFNGFLLFGYKNRLEMSNLWKTLVRDRADCLVPLLREAWTRTCTDAKRLARKQTYQSVSGKKQYANSINMVLFKMYWVKLFFVATLKLIQDSLQFMTPMILKKLLSYMRSTTDPEWHGTLYAVLFLIVPTIQSLVLNNYFYHMQVIGVQIRTMLIGCLYRKALVLSGSARMQSTSGEIVNLMAVDSQRFQDLLLYLNLFWSAPFQISLAILLLYRELGWAVFAGIGSLALMLPINAYLASRSKRAQVKLMHTKDNRVKQMNEVLSGVKVIKLYAWENSFIANLFGLRAKELDSLKRILTLDAFQTFIWQCSPFIVAMVTFAVYVNIDDTHTLDAEKAFVSISLFNLLRFPLTMLPMLVTNIVMTVVSAKRLNKFFNSDEIVDYVTRDEDRHAITIEGGTLSWSEEEQQQQQQQQEGEEKKEQKDKQEEPSEQRIILRDIDLHVEPKSFVAIVGQVASGKSSLLASILGEMHRITGRFNVCKSMQMAYVPQQAWIQNMTVRDNILFSLPYNEERYKQVLSVCALESDLETLPAGDQAEIGEKGINLSGGQKQRVSLARACYSNSDIFLLDDPLSALDSHVGKLVYDQVLSSKTGLLRNKTRVLATNSLFVLPHVDHIVVLDQGRIVESGSYQELMAKESGYLVEIMRQYLSNNTEQGGTKQSQESGSSSSPIVVDQKKFEKILENEDKLMKSVMPKQELGRLVEVEKLETGEVNYRVYLSYFKNLSWFWLIFVVLAMVASAVFNIATNLWLSVWSSDAEDENRSKDTSLRMTRLVVYSVLGGSQCVFILAGAIGLSRGAVRAARKLHSILLEKIMHSPMSFFDTTPIGRIVNRFAKDIDVVDTTIPGALRSWLNCCLQVMSTMIVICYSFPTFFIIVIPLGIIYYLIQKVFIVTTRQLKRLESITRSPIYSHFNETLSGISTIRAYNCVDRFVCHSDTLVDRNQSCIYPNIVANRWLSVRLELFGNLIAACAALFSVHYKGTVTAGIAGLTISYCLSITQTLSWLVRMTSDLETNIVSVERILEYTRNKQEDLWIKDNSRPPANWPDKGAIKLENYSTRYRDDTELVIKNMSIDIKACEKIGIVGRTGSGKSSLSLSLFRILEPASGRMIIDGLDLANYGLYDLRSKLTIIPQDPVLFSGTLRFNLDPLNLYKDFEIWRALELAHLRAYISSLDDGLDYKVSEYGANFSVGQRQLICLARAILRKSKILILDEATASVDLETDSIVQRTIRNIFNDCTIITIAHRLHTILDSDRILVLEKGEVRELDSPQSLIANQKSAFYSLAKDAGIDTTKLVAPTTNATS